MNKKGNIKKIQRQRIYSIDINNPPKNSKIAQQSFKNKNLAKINKLSMRNHHKTEVSDDACTPLKIIKQCRLSQRKNMQISCRKSLICIKDNNKQEQKRQKYFVRRGYKKSTLDIRNSQIKSERKSLNNKVMGLNRNNNKSHKIRGSIMSQRSYRLHTIDQVKDDQVSEQKQQMIRGCIASLQNILTDMTNNRRTSGLEVRQQKKKQVLKGELINKTNILKQKSEQDEIWTIRKTENCSKYQKQNRKKAKNYEDYLIVKQQSDKLIKKQDQCNTHTKNVKNDFKSYIQHLKNKKRQNQINIVKKIKTQSCCRPLDNWPNEGTSHHKSNQNKQKISLIDQPQINKSTVKIQFNPSRQQNRQHIDIDNMQISNIQKVNQSSFLSQWGKNAIKNQVNIIDGTLQNQISNQKLTQALIKKKIGYHKSPLNRDRKKQRKLTTICNYSGVQNNFPKGFFQ